METPVLLLVYNRPEQTIRVLQRLKECGATNVFVSGDGPKNSLDRLKTEEVKSCVNRFSPMISASRFSDKNRGCKNSVIDGINWFFENVEEGIILEDDCLPSEHFFPFINELIGRYREEKKVQMISGNNPLGTWESEGNHFFSRIGHIWGWATWKDRWNQFNSDLPELQKFILTDGFERAFGPTALAESRKQLTHQSAQGEIDTWDYQWMAHILMQNGLAVVPTENLVENIGFDNSGTNLTAKPNWICNEVHTGKTQTEYDYPIYPSSVDGSSPFKKGVSSRFYGKTGDFFQIDREYEMELALCKQSDSVAKHSSFYFSEKGKSAHRKLNIVLINSTDIGGGAEKMTLGIHQELLKRGHISTLLVQYKKSELDSVEELKSETLEQILKLKPDVIHVHNMHGTTLQLDEIASLSQEIPLVFTLHDSWLTTGSKTHPFVLDATQLSFLETKEWKNELTARKAIVHNSKIRFTVPSQWLRERFFNAHGIKAYFVPNGIERVEPTKVEIPSNRYILFVANNAETNPYKDFLTLKKAWIKANRELADLAVDLVCVSGEAKNDVIGDRQLIILPKLDNSEIISLMENALFTVQASKQDNSPLTILEAHSVNRPVIASLVGGILELLSEKELELTFSPEDVQKLKCKLIEAVNHFSTETSGFKVSKVPTVEQVVDAYLGHYLQLIDG